MSKEILASLGLSDNEAEVYLLLLQMQEALASEIARKSRISRPHIYDTIAKLIGRGLASYAVKNGRKYFKPANPEMLNDMLKSKQASLQSILPQLKGLYTPAKEKPLVEVYEGKEGLKTVLNDVLRTGKELCTLGPAIKPMETVPAAIGRYFKQGEKLGPRARMLIPEGTDVSGFRADECRFLPKQYSSPATTMMYGSKTCFVLWLDPIIAVRIDNKEFAASFRSYFDLMWDSETKTYTGKDGAKAFLDDILKTRPKEYMIMGSFGNIAQILPKYRFDWDKKRVAAGIKVKRIYNDSEEARKASKVYAGLPLREHRFVQIQESPLAICTYENKAWIISWIVKNPLFILIENAEIALGFKNQFEQLWDQEERISRH